jgi:hypothetical protein
VSHLADEKQRKAVRRTAVGLFLVAFLVFAGFIASSIVASYR